MISSSKIFQHEIADIAHHTETSCDCPNNSEPIAPKHTDKPENEHGQGCGACSAQGCRNLFVPNSSANKALLAPNHCRNRSFGLFGLVFALFLFGTNPSAAQHSEYKGTNQGPAHTQPSAIGSQNQGNQTWYKFDLVLQRYGDVLGEGKRDLRPLDAESLRYVQSIYQNRLKLLGIEQFRITPHQRGLYIHVLAAEIKQQRQAQRQIEKPSGFLQFWQWLSPPQTHSPRPSLWMLRQTLTMRGVWQMQLVEDYSTDADAIFEAMRQNKPTNLREHELHYNRPNKPRYVRERFFYSANKAELQGWLALWKQKLAKQYNNRYRLMFKRYDPDHKKLWRSTLVHSEILLHNAHISVISVQINEMWQQPELMIRLTPGGQSLFANLTARNIGRKLAIIIDGRIWIAPIIQSAIPGGRIIISFPTMAPLQHQMRIATLYANVMRKSLSNFVPIITTEQTINTQHPAFRHCQTPSTQPASSRPQVTERPEPKSSQNHN